MTSRRGQQVGRLALPLPHFLTWVCFLVSAALLVTAFGVEGGMKGRLEEAIAEVPADVFEVFREGTRSRVVGDVVLIEGCYQFPLSVLEGLRGLPGLAAVAAEGIGPCAICVYMKRSDKEPLSTGQEGLILVPVTPDYFAVRGIPLAAGRSFTTSEAEDAAPVAVVGFKRPWSPGPGERPQMAKISPDDLEAHGLAPGDTFTFLLDDTSAREHTFTVVGTLPETGDLEVDDCVFIPIGALPLVDEPEEGRGGFRFWCQPQDGELERAMADVQSALEEYNGPDGLVRCMPSRISQVVFRTLSKTSAAGLLAISGLALVVLAGNLVALLMLHIVNNSPRIGVRRSLGAPTLAVFGEVALAALRLAALPSLLGLLAGAALSPWTGRLLGESVRPGLIPLTRSAGAIVAVTLLAALYPASVAVSLPPARVMRGALPLPVGRPFWLDPRTLIVLLLVAVGVGAVVTAAGIGRGVDASIEVYLAGVGEGVVEVKPPQPGMRAPGASSAGPAPTIDDQLLGQLAGLPGVEASSLALSMPATIASGGPSGEDGPAVTAWVAGVSPGYMRVWNLRLSGGRWLEEADQDCPVAVVGHSLARRLGIQGSDAPAELVIGGTTFTVVGWLEPRQDKVLDFAVDRDNAVFIPHRSLTLIEDFRYQVTSLAIFLKAADRDGAGLVDEVTGFLREQYPGHTLPQVRQPAGDLSKAQRMQRQTYRIFTLLSGLVLAMAVAGLVNLFFMRVSEMRRYIGVRRALGATLLRIALRHMGEGALLVTAGAALGVAGSWAVLSATGYALDWPVVLSAPWIGGAAVLALAAAI
ncbi:MAG: ABC transporter permease, partial [Firmicutes bacterium]|nr:ABC transporter permease [Bacillota bacterium]